MWATSLNLGGIGYLRNFVLIEKKIIFVKTKKEESTLYSTRVQTVIKSFLKEFIITFFIYQVHIIDFNLFCVVLEMQCS